MWAHQFAEYQHAAERLGLERFATMQNHYNVLYREEEREMLPYCEQEGVTMAQVGLAWLLHQPAVDAPIVGTTSVEHLEDAVEATELSQSDSGLEYLEEPYEPTAVSGHQ